MKIEIVKRMVSGDVEILPGTYWASVQADLSKIALVGRGVAHLITATNRPAKKAIRSTEVQFYPGMSTETWILVVKVPPKKEWMAVLVMQEKAKKKKKTRSS